MNKDLLVSRLIQPLLLAAVSSHFFFRCPLYSVSGFHQCCPALVGLATQLDKNVQGRLMWNAGIQSNVNTMAIWDTERHHLTGAIQVNNDCCVFGN